MKKLSLRPYHGSIYLCKTLRELRKEYEGITENDYPYDDDPDGGRYIRLDSDKYKGVVWLVYAKNTAALAHEFSHVLLHTFRAIGHDPTEGDGEPFCYMLSQLMLEAE